MNKDSSAYAVEGAIRNPNNANHLMIVRPVPRTIRVYVGDVLIAQTNKALRVLEMGNTLYDPALYIPKQDITANLTALDKTSHCPLKGEAHYVAYNGDEIAWSYAAAFDFAAQLNDHYAFWPDKVRVEEGE